LDQWHLLTAFRTCGLTTEVWNIFIHCCRLCSVQHTWYSQSRPEIRPLLEPVS
jgi:hypothetical protein